MLASVRRMGVKLVFIKTIVASKQTELFCGKFYFIYLNNILCHLNETLIAMKFLLKWFYLIYIICNIFL